MENRDKDSLNVKKLDGNDSNIKMRILIKYSNYIYPQMADNQVHTSLTSARKSFPETRKRVLE